MYILNFSHSLYENFAWILTYPRVSVQNSRVTLVQRKARLCSETSIHSAPEVQILDSSIMVSVHPIVQINKKVKAFSTCFLIKTTNALVNKLLICI